MRAMTPIELPDLPDDIDPDLWFSCVHDASARDYFYNARWHTFPGRMPAYCPSRHVSFRVSLAELPSELPVATRYWVEGFLVGNMPTQPYVEDEDDPALIRWRADATAYFDTGYWPRSDETDAP